MRHFFTLLLLLYLVGCNNECDNNEVMWANGTLVDYSFWTELSKDNDILYFSILNNNPKIEDQYTLYYNNHTLLLKYYSSWKNGVVLCINKMDISDTWRGKWRKVSTIYCFQTCYAIPN